MPLTPADVHNVAFKKPPIGKRGYDEDEVDNFLDLVETELARLIEENNDLKGQVDDLQRRPSAAPVAAAPQQQQQPQVNDRDRARELAQARAEGERQGRAAAEAQFAQQRAALERQAQAPQVVEAPAAAVVPDANPESALGVLALAQETAHLAQQRAEKITNEAKAESERVRRETAGEMERMIAEARTKADAMQGDARSRAEALERDARRKAAALTAEAERRHNEVMGSLELKKGDLEKAIAGLRAFEREYRTRLRSYLESQLGELDSRGSAEPSGAPASVAAGGARSMGSPTNGAPNGSSGGSRSYGGPSVGQNGRHDDAAAATAGQHSHG